DSIRSTSSRSSGVVLERCFYRHREWRLDEEIQLLHARQGGANGRLVGRFDGDDEGQIMRVFIRQLQHGFDGDVLGGQRRGQLRDDAGAVFYTKTQVVRGAIERDGNGTIFAEAGVRKGRYSLGAARSDLAGNTHQI